MTLIFGHWKKTPTQSQRQDSIFISLQKDKKKSYTEDEKHSIIGNKQNLNSLV
jgi:hypothetical protein